MEPQFGSLWIDLLIVAICGLAGGFGLGLLQENGFEVPRVRKVTEKKDEVEKKTTYYFDLGFLADMLVGALAGVIVYALNPPSSELQLIAVGLTAGLGGAGILKGYVQAQKSQELSGVAQEALTMASMQAAMITAQGWATPPAAPAGEGAERGLARELEEAMAGEDITLPAFEPQANIPVYAQQARIDILQQRVDELTRKAR